MASKKGLGQWGEALAADYLKQLGYAILERNVRTPYGEIDLIAQDSGELVFVEVKTRASSSLGPPEIAITSRKQEHILSAAQAYLQSHPHLEGNWRVDVIAIQRLSDQQPQITHFENVFT